MHISLYIYCPRRHGVGRKASFSTQSPCLCRHYDITVPWERNRGRNRGRTELAKRPPLAPLALVVFLFARFFTRGNEPI
ncbi:hypothetical protein BDV19DRAFT_363780 [Aspergillus venezuelensis]